MLMAQLRGKLPTDIWRDSEDLLTSAVFGTLKNLPDSLTVRLLARAEPLQKGAEPPALSTPLAWSFWPDWETCQPDVVIEDAANLCVIEAKLYSGFAKDNEKGNQLQREWEDGLLRATQSSKSLMLVALTNHAISPDDSIRRQLIRCDADLVSGIGDGNRGRSSFRRLALQGTPSVCHRCQGGMDCNIS